MHFRFAVISYCQVLVVYSLSSGVPLLLSLCFVYSTTYWDWPLLSSGCAPIIGTDSIEWGLSDDSESCFRIIFVLLLVCNGAERELSPCRDWPLKCSCLHLAVWLQCDRLNELTMFVYMLMYMFAISKGQCSDWNQPYCVMCERVCSQISFEQIVQLWKREEFHDYYYSIQLFPCTNAISMCTLSHVQHAMFKLNKGGIYYVHTWQHGSHLSSQKTTPWSGAQLYLMLFPTTKDMHILFISLLEESNWELVCWCWEVACRTEVPMQYYLN